MNCFKCNEKLNQGESIVFIGENESKIFYHKNCFVSEKNRSDAIILKENLEMFLEYFNKKAIDFPVKIKGSELHSMFLEWLNNNSGKEYTLFKNNVGKNNFLNACLLYAHIITNRNASERFLIIKKIIKES